MGIMHARYICDCILKNEVHCSASVTGLGSAPRISLSIFFSLTDDLGCDVKAVSTARLHICEVLEEYDLALEQSRPLSDTIVSPQLYVES